MRAVQARDEGADQLTRALINLIQSERETTQATMALEARREKQAHAEERAKLQAQLAELKQQLDAVRAEVRELKEGTRRGGGKMPRSVELDDDPVFVRRTEAYTPNARGLISPRLSASFRNKDM